MQKGHVMMESWFKIAIAKGVKVGLKKWYIVVWLLQSIAT